MSYLGTFKFILNIALSLKFVTKINKLSAENGLNSIIILTKWKKTDNPYLCAFF